MHLSDFISVVFEHYEPIIKLCGVVLAVCATTVAALKRFYKNYSKVKDKSILANVRYLEKFGRYLSAEEKELVSSRVSNEILQNVLTSRIAINRKYLSYLYLKLDDKSFFTDVLKVQGALRVIDGNFFVEPGQVFSFSFWFERFLALICAVLFLFFTSVALLANIKYQQSFVFLVLLIMALACEMAGFYCLSATPGRSRLKKINSALSEVDVKPEWL